MKTFHVSTIGLALFCLPALAANSMFTTTLEPIVGYERVQKLVPTAHSRDRLVYGARATLGIPFLSLEAEYTRSTDTESFADTLTTITDTDDKARLGLRTRYQLLGLASLFVRGGVQARQTRHQTTVVAVSTTTTDPIVYNPYLGAGAQVHFGSQFSLTADVTTVFRSFPSFTDNDYMVTAGFVVSFP